MIRPTLFVGLGTTGLKILKGLRSLIFEEYERTGLPIFRYVCLETDRAEDGGDPTLRLTNHEYEKITLIHTTIGNTIPIESKTTPGDPLHDKNLADWLNNELLQIGDRSFTAGANNIRMAGRLCLWENWTDVIDKFNNQLNAINSPENVSAASDFLKNHYGRKKITSDDNVVDDSGRDVYVMGTLCGGTCGGMLIDIAYYFRSILTNATDKSYGIFTMYDTQHAGDKKNQVRSANCYGSLLELNYYNYIGTEYSCTFPDGHEVERIKDPPFDYTMFVSRSAHGRRPSQTGVKFSDSNGQFDEDGLNQMVSLNLLADAVGGGTGAKNQIRTDWSGHTGWRQLKSVEQSQIATMSRYMASFGLTAVWYPKDRISTASACLIGERLCEDWLKSYQDVSLNEREAKDEWPGILKKHIDILSTPRGRGSLKIEIDDLISQARTKLENIESADELKHRMKSYPSPNDTFRDKFSIDGEYYDLIERQVPVCQKALLDELRECIRNKVSKIGFGNKYGLGDVESFFKYMDKEIENMKKQCSDRLPDSLQKNLEQLDFSTMKKVGKSLSIRLVGMRDDAISEKREKLIDEYCKYVNKAYIDLRNYFLGPILEELRRELGFQIKPDNSPPNQKRTTVETMLSAIKENLDSCKIQLEEDHKDAVNPPEQIHVVIVASNSDNSISADADSLSYQIDPNVAKNSLLNEKTMYDFLNQDAKEIINKIKGTYRRLSLSNLTEFHVVTKAQKMTSCPGTDPISVVASHSIPYQVFNGKYQALPMPTAPTLIYGQDPDQGDLKNLKTTLAGKNILFARTSISTIDHLLFFYQEEAGFAIDDLQAYSRLSRRFLATPGPYGHYTHQDPTFYDLEFYVKKKRLETWIKALRVLVPTIAQHVDATIFSDLFYMRDGKYYHHYRISGLLNKLCLTNDQEGIDSLARRESMSAYNNFISQVRLSFQRFQISVRSEGETKTFSGRGAAEELINRLLRSIDDQARLKNESKFYKTFLDDVYSESIIRQNDQDDGLSSDFADDDITEDLVIRTEPKSTPKSVRTDADSSNQSQHTSQTDNATVLKDPGIGKLSPEEKEAIMRMRQSARLGPLNPSQQQNQPVDTQHFASPEQDPTKSSVDADTSASIENDTTQPYEEDVEIIEEEVELLGLDGLGGLSNDYSSEPYVPEQPDLRETNPEEDEFSQSTQPIVDESPDAPAVVDLAIHNAPDLNLQEADLVEVEEEEYDSTITQNENDMPMEDLADTGSESVTDLPDSETFDDFSDIEQEIEDEKAEAVDEDKDQKDGVQVDEPLKDDKADEKKMSPEQLLGYKRKRKKE